MDKACVDRAYTDRACIDRAYIDRAYIDKAYDIIYSKSPISLGNGGFISIKGPKRLEVQLGF